MGKNRSKPKKVYQGFLLAIELTETKLVYTFCRLIPLSWVKLNDVDCLRASFFEDIFPRRKKFLRFLRNRYWVSSIRGGNRRLTPFYVIETRNKHRRIFLRMESSFHYRVRCAIGREKSNKIYN